MRSATRASGRRCTFRGGIIRPHVESLRVGGRDRTRLVHGVTSQIERVSLALDDTTVPVRGALCLIEADWPLIGGGLSVDGIHVVWPRLLVKRMIEAPPHGIDVAGVHERLAAAFPRA